MRWPQALGLSVFLLAGVAGCRNKCGLVENQLRAREDDVHFLRDELDRSECMNQALTRELAARQGLPGPCGVVERPTEPYPVKAIRLGRGTSGKIADCGGDEALTVQVEPVDCDGQTIKAPGGLYVEAIEVTKEGLKRPLSAWEVPPDELRRKYQSGLFTSGYVVTFPWKVAPTTEKLRVLARFKMLDGRVFEADKDITIRLLPEGKRLGTEVILPGPVNGSPPVVTPPVMTPGPELPKPIEVVPPAPKPEGTKPSPAGAVVPTLTSGKAKGSGGVLMLRPVRIPEVP